MLLPILVLITPLLIPQEPVIGGTLYLSSITCRMENAAPTHCKINPGKTLDDVAKEFYNLLLTEADNCDPADPALRMGGVLGLEDSWPVHQNSTICKRSTSITSR